MSYSPITLTGSGREYYTVAFAEQSVTCQAIATRFDYVANPCELGSRLLRENPTHQAGKYVPGKVYKAVHICPSGQKIDKAIQVIAQQPEQMDKILQGIKNNNPYCEERGNDLVIYVDSLYPLQ